MSSECQIVWIHIRPDFFHAWSRTPYPLTCSVGHLEVSREAVSECLVTNSFANRIIHYFPVIPGGPLWITFCMLGNFVRFIILSADFPYKNWWISSESQTVQIISDLTCSWAWSRSKLFARLSADNETWSPLAGKQLRFTTERLFLHHLSTAIRWASFH